MKRPIYLTLISAAVMLTGCSNPMEYVTPSTSAPSTPKSRNVARIRYETPTPEKEAKFHQTMIAVAKSTKLDPNYKKLSLNTPEEKAWFQKLMYRLWDRQITRAQFIAEGVAKYPDHKYEFTYIANAFQNY